MEASRSYDFLIRAGRVVNPAESWQGPGAVAVRGDLQLPAPLLHFSP
jgi:hypothetical protein